MTSATPPLPDPIMDPPLPLPEPWDRLLGERGSAWAAFQTFRDLGPGRTLPAAFEAVTGRSLGVNRAGMRGRRRLPGNWQRWYKDHDWRGRAEAWDAHQERLRQQVAEQAARDTAARLHARREQIQEAEFSLAEQLLDRARRMLQHPHVQVTQKGRDGQTTIIEPYHWNARDIAALVLAASKLGRMSTGMETDRRTDSTTGRPAAVTGGSSDSSDSSEALRRLFEVAATLTPDDLDLLLQQSADLQATVAPHDMPGITRLQDIIRARRSGTGTEG